MKGQAIFEFMVAAVIFFGIVFYIIGYLNANVLAMGGAAYSNVLENRAVQISEVLLRSPGDWTESPPSIGLTSEEGWPVLDPVKVQSLSGICEDNYNIVLERLGLKETPLIGVNRSFALRVDIDGSKVCGPDYVPVGVEKGSITRYGVQGGVPVPVSVVVW